MKRLFVFFFCFGTIVMNLIADDGTTAAINLQHTSHDNHSEYYPPADMPEVYFDYNNLEIILVADGFADYYDVNIISQSTQLAVISTQVDGYRDTIDVSSLPDDDYTIIITSSNNNEYVGHFTNKNNRYRRRN